MLYCSTTASLHCLQESNKSFYSLQNKNKIRPSKLIGPLTKTNLAKSRSIRSASEIPMTLAITGVDSTVRGGSNRKVENLIIKSSHVFQLKLGGESELCTSRDPGLSSAADIRRVEAVEVDTSSPSSSNLTHPLPRTLCTGSVSAISPGYSPD